MPSPAPTSHRTGTALIHRQSNSVMGTPHSSCPHCWCKPHFAAVLCSCDEPGSHVLDEWDRPQLLR